MIRDAFPCTAFPANCSPKGAEQGVTVKLRFGQNLAHSGFESFAKLAAEVIDDLFGFYASHSVFVFCGCEIMRPNETEISCGGRESAGPQGKCFSHLRS